MHSKHSVQAMSTDEAISSFKTSLSGLSDGESKKRLLSSGQNLIKNEAKSTVLKLIISQLKSALIYLLVIATVLAYILGDLTDASIILAILLINTGLGFYQQYRSENAVSKLQKLISKESL